MKDDKLTTIQQAASSAIDPPGEGDVTSKILFPTESNIISLVLKKRDRNGKEIEFQLLPWKSEILNRSPLSTIQFKESLFDMCMFGKVIVFDDRNWVDDFQFNSLETLEIKFKISDSTEIIDLKFFIYDAKNISDETYIGDTTSADERISVWSLDFVSSELFFANFNDSFLETGKDFVGEIALNPRKETDDGIEGLVNLLFKKYNLKKKNLGTDEDGKKLEYDIEKPGDGQIWLKYDNVSYPWMKRWGQRRILTLLKSVANYVVGEYQGGEYERHDFFVWEDRDGWSFKSFTEMALDPLEPWASRAKKPTEGFIITIDPLVKNRILSWEVINQYNIQNLLESGAFYSSYIRITPNWSNPYLDFTSSNDSFLEQIVSYDYTKDYSIPTIGEYRLLPDNFKIKTTTDIGTPNYAMKVDDQIYGYYSKNFLNTPFHQEWDSYGRTLHGPLNSIAWQPQFDITETELDFAYQESDQNFDIKTLGYAIPLIREELKANRAEYARQKDIKRKWEVYRCTICCSENAAVGSTLDAFNLLNPGPVDGITYNLLFGPTGYYGSKQTEKYEVVAAGSFTDLLNYNIGSTLYERGLTYSYDLTKAPYNEKIGQFFNLTGPTAPEAYQKLVLERTVKLYDQFIEKLEERIQDLTDFIVNPARCSNYKTIADAIYSKLLIGFSTVTDNTFDAFYAPTDRAIDPLIDGFKFVGEAVAGESLNTWPIRQYEFGLVPDLKVPARRGVGQVLWNKNLQDQDCVNTENAGYTFANLCSQRWNNVNETETPQPVYEQVHNYSFFGPGTISIWFENPYNQFNNPSEENCFAYPNWYQMVEIFYPLVNGQPNDSYRAFVSSGGYFENGEFISSEFTGQSFLATFEYLTGLCGPSGDDGLGGSNDNLDYDNFIIRVTPFTSTPLGNCIQGNNYFWNYLIGCPNLGDPRFFRPSDIYPQRGPSGFDPQIVASPFDLIEVNPLCYRDCSTDPIIRGYVKYATNGALFNSAETPPYDIYSYAAPYLWDEEVQNWSFFDYGTDKGLFPAIVDGAIKQATRTCLQSGDCINTTCLSSTALEVLRRTCIAERQLLSVELEIYQFLKTRIEEFYNQKFIANYAEWYSRSAFFFSKKPGQNIFKNEERNTVQSPLSLQNIKSITRKEVKGSRYELLSRWVGITGASFGPNQHLISYQNESGSTFNPYYQQRYKSPGFISSRKPHHWFIFYDADSTNNPTNFNGLYGPVYKQYEFVEEAAIHLPSEDRGNIFKVPGGTPAALAEYDSSVGDYGYAQSDLNALQSEFDVDEFYKNTFNFYNLFDENEVSKKPPDIKKEEISSYIRIEFQNPIGIGTQKDFPNGFVRDAGVEYFIPYIVNLTVGPMGRQGVKYNAAVIGMDPYGFDVAVKKIKDDLPSNRKLQGIQKGNYYDWWNHDTGSVLSKTEYLTTDYNGMDLWPESGSEYQNRGFETEFPYYAFDPTQEDIHGAYEMDFHMGGGYYFENDSQDWMESLYHYGMASGKQFDPLYRSSVVGSYILPNSYRKLKAHRSWWSFFVPRNLFIPIRFANMMMKPNTKARDLFGGRGIFTVSPNYWKTWYGSEFQTWCDISRSGIASFVNPREDSVAPDLIFFGNTVDDGEAINALTNSASQFFSASLNNYLAGNFTLYRPGLVETDLWKYDLSGETEYGLVTPPVDAEYDFFDRNFALQFTVHARSSTTSCKDLGLECANPKAIKDGPIPLEYGCTASMEPYCGCPAKNLMPKEPEPTYAQLQDLYNKTSECALIEKYLGKEYLGCEYSNPKSSCSCNCPEQGEYFYSYLEQTRTYATFWNIDHRQPLVRQAQLAQIQSQKIIITIASNQNVKIGSIIEIINANDIPEATTNKYKKVSGSWMVAEISHSITQNNYYMLLTLVRNGLHYDPNESISPIAVLRKQEEE